MLASLPSGAEFWSGIIGAVIGAVVGGCISFVLQRQSAREGRAQRQEDHLRTQQGLATHLLFKVIRIHSDFHGIRRHIEDSFARAAAEDGGREPWEFVLPLANFPETVHFTPEEMGMLLSLKDDTVFEKVFDLDVAHNSSIEAIRTMSSERKALTDIMKATYSEANTAEAALDKDTYMALKPRMVGINNLVESIRSVTETDVAQSGSALEDLANLIRERLGLELRLENKLAPKTETP